MQTGSLVRSGPAGSGSTARTSIAPAHSIIIPFSAANDKGTNKVQMFVDELPVGGGNESYDDLLDLLTGELAPLNVWRTCAVEYHKQGYDAEFDSLLNELFTAIQQNPNILANYRKRPDFDESMAEIHHALAAKSLSRIGTGNNKRAEEAYIAGVLENVQKAEQNLRFTDYSWLIKGFFEMRNGDLKRAEDHFKLLHDRANKAHPVTAKKHMFGALIGLGIVNYENKRYTAARDFMIKAIQSHPGCSASVRVAFAACCFKLEEYDRAQAALQVAINMEPANPNALVLKALLEQVYSQKQKDKSKRLEHRMNAYDYCVIAAAIDPKCSTALNHLANHLFHTWTLLAKESAVAVERTVLQVPRTEEASSAKVGDHIKIEGVSTIFSITEIRTTSTSSSSSSSSSSAASSSSSSSNTDDHLLLVLSDEMPENVVGSTLNLVEVKLLGKVIDLSTQALQSSQLKGSRSESYYVRGRALHAQGKMQDAFSQYKRAVDEMPDMVLAIFAMGQVHLTQNAPEAALGAFERVLAKVPDDKETMAYVILLRGQVKQEKGNLDKVKEVAAGFLYEADLWLGQARLLQKESKDYGAALKCYKNAMECMEQKGIPIDSVILSNVVVLYHSLGKLSQAINYMKRAIMVAPSSSSSSSTPSASSASTSSSSSSTNFKNSDLEDIFYKWSNPIATLEIVDASNAPRGATIPMQFIVKAWEAQEDDDGMSVSHNLSHLLNVGDEIVINDIRHTVTSIRDDGNGFESISPLSHLHTIAVSAGEEMLVDGDVSTPPPSLHLRRKISTNKFHDDNLTLCYNFARILEDTGRSKAAAEIYVELVKQHPSFLECYLRLSRIDRDQGKFNEASVWLSRALAVSEDDPDANVCLGDLYARFSQWEDAKKCLEKICISYRHDPRSMLSLGNLYFENLNPSSTSKYEKDLKQSYKFFHQVLADDKDNVYAAVGLGMVCAEKKEYDVAREVFTKAREAGMPHSEDICSNLAHVHLISGRLIDAEHLYQATLKTLHHSKPEKAGALSECLAMAQYKHRRHDEALKTLLRSIHREPNVLRSWYNVAVVRGDFAIRSMMKKSKGVTEIQDAARELELAHKLYTFLSTTDISQTSKPHYDRNAASQHAAVCEKNLLAFEDVLQEAQRLEEERQQERIRQEEEHRARTQAKLEEKARQLEEQEAARRALQERALKKRMDFEEKKAEWATQAPPEGGGGKGRKTKGSAAGNGESQSSEYDFLGDEEDADLGADNIIDKTLAERNEEIDFGSDDDEDMGTSNGNGNGNASKRQQRSSSPTNDKVLHDELFGDDDDDDNDNNEGGKSSARTTPTGKLKRPRDAGDDEDEELDFLEGEQSKGKGKGTEERSTKRRGTRIDDDDDDDE